MDAVMHEINQAFRKAGLAHQAVGIVVAVSGGVDSMVLAHALAQLSQMQDFAQIRWTLAHFDHRLRPNSSQDSDRIRAFAQAQDWPYFIGHWDQPAQKNVEMRARQARYRFLACVAQAVEADYLCLGHHLNDQAETVLMRWVRGASVKSGWGINPDYERNFHLEEGQVIRLRLLRPLIGLEKERLYRYAHQYKISYEEDTTNTDLTYLRNRLRHEVIPLVRRENPKVLHHLHQLALDMQLSFQAHYEHFLSWEPNLLAPVAEGGWMLFVPAWWQLGEATRRVFLNLFFESRVVDTLPTYSRSAIDQVWAILMHTGEPNLSMPLNRGWIAQRRYDMLYIGPQVEEVGKETPVLPLWPYNTWISLSEEERIGLFEMTVIEAQHLTSGSLIYPLHLEEEAVAHFYVRHRQKGDRIQLQSGEGHSYHKKVRRFLIDAKIPLAQRKQTWLVADDNGQVIWIIDLVRGGHPQRANESSVTHAILYQKLHKF